MSIWGSIKGAAGDFLDSAAAEARVFGSEYVSNIWGGDSPEKEAKAANAETIASLPRAAPTDKAGTGALMPKQINWQAVAAIAAVVGAVAVVLKSR